MMGVLIFKISKYEMGICINQDKRFYALGIYNFKLKIIMKKLSSNDDGFFILVKIDICELKEYNNNSCIVSDTIKRFYYIF